MAAKTRKVNFFPEPEFHTSAELRTYCNEVRRGCHQLAMVLHISASEIEAALATINPSNGVISKWQRKRRARRVARHMRHAAECIVGAGAASVRTWGAFKAEFAPELAPVRGRQRTSFRVVPE